ncbi:MAG: DNA methyltransferase [Planctomycetota bacterium]
MSQALSTTPALNKDTLVHGWYLIPESYSAPLIEEAIDEFGLKAGDTILDPFCGAGTTLVAAAFRGIHGVGFEVNPFLCFAAEVKLDWTLRVDDVRKEKARLLARVRRRFGKLGLMDAVAEREADWQVEGKQGDLFDGIQMPRLHRWISPNVVAKALTLKEEILKVQDQKVRRLFLLALAAILRPCSNMKLTPHAFGSREPKDDAPVLDAFCEKLNKMIADLEEISSNGQETPRAVVVNADSKYARGAAHPLLPANLAVTSPPYLNNLDYTMQTRLELFFLDFVKDMKDLRAVRKRMVTCDAKAMYKDVPDSERVASFRSIQSIARRLKEKHKGKNWGWDYSFMTTQYFGGMHRVLESVLDMLKPDARFVLIVGESAHSGIKVPVPQIIGELGKAVGYSLDEIRVCRNRRSSSHSFSLDECAVILRKP